MRPCETLRKWMRQPTSGKAHFRGKLSARVRLCVGKRLQPKLRIRDAGFLLQVDRYTKLLSNHPAECHKRGGFCVGVPYKLSKPLLVSSLTVKRCFLDVGKPYTSLLCVNSATLKALGYQSIRKANDLGIYPAATVDNEAIRHLRASRDSLGSQCSG